MANKKNKNSGGQSDIYQQMYEQQLKKFQSMDSDNYDGTEDNLRFYTEEELAAIEQAKRDAAQQAYQDAYQRQYRQSQQQYQNPQRRRVNPTSQRYAKAAKKKHQNEQIEFGSNNSYNNSKHGKKKISGGSIVGGFFKAVFIILIVLILLLQLLIFRYISMIKSVETGDRQVTNAALSSSKVTNILLIGSDTRDETERGRTDSMILLSFNSETKKTTMTSLMRDSYVEIPDHGWAKLNAAYAYGGAELLMDTIELNFDIEVEKYVYVSFFSFIDIVDAVGGIEIDLSDEEAQYMTDPMAEQNKYLGNKKGTDYLTQGGNGVQLNGNQALAYARLRYVGNADFERTQRQRTVITKIIEKAKTLGPLDLDTFFKVCASNLTTNMTKGEMYLMVYKLLFSMNYENQQLRIPGDDDYYYGTHNGQSTLDLDFDACKRELKETIYN
jgi:LCP family protein required for cell wall assembly